MKLEDAEKVLRGREDYGIKEIKNQR